MKKIYAVTFLTTTIISTTTCMEKPRPRRQSYEEEEAQFPPVSPSSVVPIYINSIPPVMPRITPINNNYKYQPLSQNIPVCEAAQPGEQLNKIANTTYRHQQQDSKNEVELSTIYRPATTINTNNILTTTQQNTHLMEQLYNNAYTFVDYERTTTKIDVPTEHKNLYMLINSMNSAKNNGLTEDDMGTFAYKSYDRDTTSRYIPLLFCCLKRYNLTIKETKENVPVHINAFDKNLTQIFGIKEERTCTYTSNAEQINAFLESYPAYNHLLSKLRILIATKIKPYTIITETKAHTIDNFAAFTSCLYAHKQLPSSHYSDGSYVNLRNEFYHKAYDLLINSALLSNMYNLLIMLNKAKKGGDIQKETDLGRAMLNFDPTPETIMEKITDFWNKKYRAIDTKNRISLLCDLIEKYNNTDPHKQRPANLQWICYDDYKKLDLALPDFPKSTLFDEKQWAFDAFEQLQRNISALIKSDEQTVQLCVNHVYYEKS